MSDRKLWSSIDAILAKRTIFLVESQWQFFPHVNPSKMTQLPLPVSLFFGLITLTTLVWVYRMIKQANTPSISRKAAIISLGLLGWLVLQGFLSWKNVYNSDLQTLPPRLVVLGILPAVLVVIGLFITHSGRAFVDSLPRRGLIGLHVIRIPVELGLYWLALGKTIPEIMTFAGRNFDILTGLTAPLIVYFGLQKGKLGNTGLLIWNFLGLALLANIVVIALLSVPTPLQQFGFDQPDLAVLNFPVVWLPVFIVPVVLFCHLAGIRGLLGNSLLSTY